MSRLLEQVESVIDGIAGYRAKLREAGFESPYVEAMTVDFHRFLMTCLASSALNNVTREPTALFDEQVYPTPACASGTARVTSSPCSTPGWRSIWTSAKPLRRRRGWTSSKASPRRSGCASSKVRERHPDGCFDVLWKF
jgi:hypothetical protein